MSARSVVMFWQVSAQNRAGYDRTLPWLIQLGWYSYCSVGMSFDSQLAIEAAPDTLFWSIQLVILQYFDICYTSESLCISCFFFAVSACLLAELSRRFFWTFAKVPELRYACACGTCIATPEGYVEARDDALVFHSLAFECHSQTVVCPDCCLAWNFTILLYISYAIRLSVPVHK